MNATKNYEKLARAGPEIERVISILDLSDTIKKELKFLYLKLIEEKATQGRAVDRVAGCLFYYLAKKDGLPYTMNEIAEKLDTDKWSLFKTYRGVNRILKLRCWGYEFESLIFKYNNDGINSILAPSIRRFHEMVADIFSYF